MVVSGILIRCYKVNPGAERLSARRKPSRALDSLDEARAFMIIAVPSSSAVPKMILAPDVLLASWRGITSKPWRCRIA